MAERRKKTAEPTEKNELEHQEQDPKVEARRERQEDEDGGGDHDDGHDHRPGHFVEITMVVNGQPVLIKATEGEKLADVRQRALTQTQNLAQPPENWEIKNEAGALLDPEKRVGEYHFGEKVTLFLSLKAGVAGVGPAGR